MLIKTLLSESQLDINEAHEFIDGAKNGAFILFLGKVRNINEGREVLAVSYDAFKPLAEKTMHEICLEAAQKFDPQMAIYLAHFKGRLELGGISVIIATSSAHRDPAYQANRYIIEQLKKRVPIWKQEHYIDGDDEWLLGTTLAPLDEMP